MAAYAYYALHKLRILPSAFLALDRAEKSFVIASIQLRAEREEEERRKAERR